MNPIEEFIFSFADDEHLIGQQHTEWIGVAPFLEEDLAFSSIGQDELGHAVLLYEVVLGLRETEATDEAIDALAYDRGASEYRSSHLVELATTDWAQALLRHWLYDTVEQFRWELVVGSSNTALAEIAIRVEREERFHRRHADALLDSLLASPVARPVLLAAFDSLTPFIANLLAPVAGETEAIAQGVVSASITTIAPLLEQRVADRFEQTLSITADISNSPGRDVRSDHFQTLMDRMREVIDYDPQAVW